MPPYHQDGLIRDLFLPSALNAPNVASHLDRSLRSVPAVRRRDHALSLPLPALPPGVLCLVLLPVVELCHMIVQFNMDHVASH